MGHSSVTKLCSSDQIKSFPSAAFYRVLNNRGRQTQVCMRAEEETDEKEMC